MPSESELSLINADWPGSLLKCNSEFLRMGHGDSLNILMDDPEIVKTLMLVIDRSENLSAELLEKNDHIWIRVVKK